MGLTSGAPSVSKSNWTHANKIWIFIINLSILLYKHEKNCTFLRFLNFNLSFFHTQSNRL